MLFLPRSSAQLKIYPCKSIELPFFFFFFFVENYSCVYSSLSSPPPTLILHSLPTLAFLSTLACGQERQTHFPSFIKASLFFVQWKILTDESVPERPCTIASNSAALSCSNLILKILMKGKFPPNLETKPLQIIQGKLIWFVNTVLVFYGHWRKMNLPGPALQLRHH